MLLEQLKNMIYWISTTTHQAERRGHLTLVTPATDTTTYSWARKSAAKPHTPNKQTHNVFRGPACITVYTTPGQRIDHWKHIHISENLIYISENGTSLNCTLHMLVESRKLNLPLSQSWTAVGRRACCMHTRQRTW